MAATLGPRLGRIARPHRPTSSADVISRRDQPTSSADIISRHRQPTSSADIVSDISTRRLTSPSDIVPLFHRGAETILR
jgi:hypothetical protein